MCNDCSGWIVADSYIGGTAFGAALPRTRQTVRSTRKRPRHKPITVPACQAANELVSAKPFQVTSQISLRYTRRRRADGCLRATQQEQLS
jgi:hypothetical protein